MTDQEFKDNVDKIVRVMPHVIGWIVVALLFVWGWVDYFHRIYQ